MCLEVITKRRLLKKEQEGEGWKSFNVGEDGEPLSIYYPVTRTSHRVPVNRWLKAKRTKVVMDYPVRGSYQSGFHIYLKVPPDSLRTYTKVKFRKGRILGRQDHAPVVVADEMYVPKAEVKNGHAV